MLEKLDIKISEKTPRQQFFFSPSILLTILKEKRSGKSRYPIEYQLKLQMARPGDLSEFAERLPKLLRKLQPY